ncbi:MAG: VOC family protein [Pseudomonadota bacterium]
MANAHGDFIWYELLTSDADAAADFYGKVIGWSFADSGQSGMDYRLFSSSAAPVGGLMAINSEMKAGGAQPAWLGYIGVDDVDVSAARIKAAGGAIHMEPKDIPDVGRFAMVADPQGVMFFIMKGASDEPSLSFASETPENGHCAWNELSTTDTAGAVDFYSGQFGWKQEGEMDMGPMGKYLFLHHGPGMIGAVMPKMPAMPVPAWTYYFRVPDIDTAVEAIKAHGGTILQEPTEIPGGDYSMNALDPQGAAFALVGARQ